VSNLEQRLLPDVHSFLLSTGLHRGETRNLFPKGLTFNFGSGFEGGDNGFEVILALLSTLLSQHGLLSQPLPVSLKGRANIEGLHRTFAGIGISDHQRLTKGTYFGRLLIQNSPGFGGTSVDLVIDIDLQQVLVLPGLFFGGLQT
jgi:hypothetical protein